MCLLYIGLELSVLSVGSMSFFWNKLVRSDAAPACDWPGAAARSSTIHSEFILDCVSLMSRSDDIHPAMKHLGRTDQDDRELMR